MSYVEILYNSLQARNIASDVVKEEIRTFLTEINKMREVKVH